MNSAKFTELSREQKEEYAKKRMNEMMLKNQKIMQRHAEVENDRINAESQNSAVTGAKLSSGSSLRRGTNVTTENKHNERKGEECAREWDRGKPNLDDWNQPEPARQQYRNFRGSGRYERKDGEKADNRNNYSRKESNEFSHHDRRSKGEFKADEQLNRGGWQNPPLKVPYRTYYKASAQKDLVDDRNYGKKEKYPSDDWNAGKKGKYPSDDWNAEKRNSYKGYGKKDGREYAPDNRKTQETWQSKPSDRNQYNSSRIQVSPRKTRGTGYRTESHRKYQSYHSDDKFRKHDFKQSNTKKKYSQKAHSKSSGKSESDGMENQFTLRTYNLWQNDKSNEDQTKQTRVERWVKSVNKSNMWAEKQLSSEENDNCGNQLSSEKQESSQNTITKFERIAMSSEKVSSDEDDIDLNTSDNVKMESSDFFSQLYNYKHNSSINTGSSPNSEFVKKCEQPDNKQNSGQDIRYASNSEFSKQNIGHYKKGFQFKHSPPFRSGGGSVNENMSKQKKDNRCYKSYDVKNKNKFRPSNNYPAHDKWNSSRNDNIVNKNCVEIDKKNDEIVDNLNEEETLPGGLWGEAEQSDIKWNLSEEETNCQEPKKDSKELNDHVNQDDSRNDIYQVAIKKDRLSDVDQSGIKCNDDDDDCTYSQKVNDQNFKHENKSTLAQAVQEVTKSDPGNNWEECKDKSVAKVPSVKDDKSYEFSVQEKSDKDVFPDLKNPDFGTANSSGLTDIQQKQFEEISAVHVAETIPVFLTDGKHTDVSTHERVLSDDGGWSTVSEEGEVE